MGRAAAWILLALVVVLPVVFAAGSSLQAYRTPAYVAASLTGVLALGLLVVQPLLAAGYLPGLTPRRGRVLHRWLGFALVAAVIVHIGGLLIANPEDALDALLLRAPTPFSVWGVAALWSVALTTLLVVLRYSLRWRPLAWLTVHNALAVVVVIGTVVHALQIEGAMETISKWLLSVAALGATATAVLHLRVFGRQPPHSPRPPPG